MDQRVKALLEDTLQRYLRQDAPLPKSLAIITGRFEKLNRLLPERYHFTTPSRYTLVRSIQAFERTGMVTARHRKSPTRRKQSLQERAHWRPLPNYLIIDNAAGPGHDIVLALWIKDL